MKKYITCKTFFKLMLLLLFSFIMYFIGKNIWYLYLVLQPTPPIVQYETMNYWRGISPNITIQGLINSSDYIILAEVIYRTEEISQEILTFSSTVRTVYYYYNSHKVKIIEVYRGSFSVGDTIQAIQFTEVTDIAVENPPWGTSKLLQTINHTTLEIGQKLILFLFSPRSTYIKSLFPYSYIVNDKGLYILTNQSAFLYTPYNLRTREGNWQFKAIDERNTLVLTEEILYSIR